MRQVVLALAAACSLTLALCVPEKGLRAETAARAARASPLAVEQSLSELAAWVAARKGELGAAIIDLGSGQTLAEHAAGLSLNPASNQKLVVAAVALAELGADFRYATSVHGQIVDGRVERLVLRGTGDPTLELGDLYDWALTLRTLGVREVSDIVVDHAYFDASFVPPAFEQQPREWAAFRAPVAALSLERNALTVNVAPTRSGQPALVWIDPPGFAELIGQVTTGSKDERQNVGLSVRASGQRVQVHVSGSVPSGARRLGFTRRVDDPRFYCALVLKHTLELMGVRISGSVREGGTDELPALITRRSEPLSSWLHRLGKASDNFYAEMLLKTFGAAGNGPASSAAGARVVESWLRRAGVTEPKIRITNGSGLFDANRLTAGSLARVLEVVYRDPVLYPEFLAQLAAGGRDGTLSTRLAGLSPAGMVRAKTGSLSQVVSLSGYVLAPGNGPPVAFSIVVNGVAGRHAEIRRRIDRVVEAVARFRWSPGKTR